MGGYIGATAVGLTTTAADVQGDITSTDTTPELILKNTSEEDTEGGREGKITFKGEQSGGEESTLAQIQSSHDGTSDDQKGDLIFKTNDGSDGASPTERLRIGSDGATTITTEGNEDSLVLKSNDADANAGPKLQFNRNSASAADADLIGEMRYSGRNDASQAVDYARIRSQVSDASDGTEDGQLQIATIVAGTMRRRVDFDATETVFNDASQDLDFRVESDSDANALFVEGSTSNVGLGTSAPLRQLSISNSSNAEMSFISGTSGIASILFGDGLTGTDVYRGYVQYQHSSDSLLFGTAAATRMTISDGGAVFIGTTGVPSNGSGGAAFRNDSNSRKNLYLSTSSANNQGLVVFDNPNGSVGSITTNGSATAYNTSSDYRLKENVTDISDGITRVKQLAPKRFNFIADADTTVDGFIAHEAATVIPEAVSGEKDAMTEEVLYVDGDEIPEGKKVGDVKIASTIDPQGIDQSKLVPLLTAALQEAIAKIETLETKVAALEG